MGKRETKLVKDAGGLILPPEGGWVVIRGNPMAPRGNRIIPSHREEGIRHFDIYWAFGEACPWKMKGHEPPKHWEPWERLHEMQRAWGITSAQSTWMTLHTPSSKMIRMWAGEVFATTEETIELMLGADYLETISFAEDNIIWAEETRDLIGSLMLDGMTLGQAQHELISARAMKVKEHKKPNWFYRPIGIFREQFSEEPEYEAWWKHKHQ